VYLHHNWMYYMIISIICSIVCSYSIESRFWSLFFFFRCPVISTIQISWQHTGARKSLFASSTVSKTMAFLAY
jgi:hypothetical protein